MSLDLEYLDRFGKIIPLEPLAEVNQENVIGEWKDNVNQSEAIVTPTQKSMQSAYNWVD